jgi:hypothetical protein
MDHAFEPRRLLSILLATTLMAALAPAGDTTAEGVLGQSNFVNRRRRGR